MSFDSSVEETLLDLSHSLYNMDVNLHFEEFDSRMLSTMTTLAEEADTVAQEAELRSEWSYITESLSEASEVAEATCSFPEVAAAVLLVAGVAGVVAGISGSFRTQLKGSDANADICPASSTLTFHDSATCEPFMYLKRDPNDALFQKTQTELVAVQPMCGGKDPNNPVNCSIMWTCDNQQQITKAPNGSSWKSQTWHLTKHSDGTMEAVDALTNEPVKFEAPLKCTGDVRLAKPSAAYIINPPTQCYDGSGDVTIMPKSLNLLKLKSNNNYVEYSCGDDRKRYTFDADEHSSSPDLNPSTYVSVTRGSSGEILSHKWKVPNMRQGYPCDALELGDCCYTKENTPGVCADSGSGRLSCEPELNQSSKCHDSSYDCDGRSAGSCCRTGDSESPIGLCREGPGPPGAISCFPMNKNGEVCHNTLLSHKNSGMCVDDHQKSHCASKLYSCYEGVQPALGQCNASASYFQNMKSCSLYCQVP